MRLNTIKLFGITVTTNFKYEILEYVRKYLAKSQKSSASWRIKSQKLEKKPLIIVTPNPEQVVLAQKDKHFAQILNQADIAIPDGVGISLAMKLLHELTAVSCQLSAHERIPGIEFMEDLVEMAQKEGYRIGLIGGRDGVAVKALECLSRRWSGLRGWAEEPRVLQLDQLDKFVKLVANKIRKTQTGMVFVGLGAPKQEYFIENVKCQMSNVKCPLIFMSVGGSFDILAGRVPRAPFIMRHIGFEWLWRLIHEPWRWKRQRALITFLWMTLRESLSKRAS